MATCAAEPPWLQFSCSPRWSQAERRSRSGGTGSGTGTATTGILKYGRLGDATTLADDIEPANTNGTWVDGTVLGARGCHRRRYEHCSGLRWRRRLRPGGAPDRRVLLDRVLVPLDAGQLDLHPDGTLAQAGTGSTSSLDEAAVYTSVLTPAQVSNHCPSGSP